MIMYELYAQDIINLFIYSCVYFKNTRTLGYDICPYKIYWIIVLFWSESPELQFNII